MTWKSLLALLMPTCLRGDAYDAYTRAASANIHASAKRRSVAVRAALSADTRTTTIETTNHRIEGRSGERRSTGEAVTQVAESTREFLRKPR